MNPIPDSSEILARLRDVVPKKVNVDPALMQPSARLADIGVDSFSLIELVFIAEEEFGIAIDVEGLQVKTVADVVAVIEQRLGATYA
jgi:acyl carrier protein